MNKALTKTLQRQRQTAPIEPIHATVGPVKAYAQWISEQKGEPHVVVTIPMGSAAHGMGYRFVSIPKDEEEYYLANGATLAEAGWDRIKVRV